MVNQTKKEAQNQCMLKESFSIPLQARGTRLQTWTIALKKIISALLIFSFFCSDVAYAMRPSAESQRDEESETRKTPPVSFKGDESHENKPLLENTSQRNYQGIGTHQEAVNGSSPPLPSILSLQQIPPSPHQENGLEKSNTSSSSSSSSSPHSSDEDEDLEKQGKPETHQEAQRPLPEEKEETGEDAPLLPKKDSKPLSCFGRPLWPQPRPYTFIEQEELSIQEEGRVVSALPDNLSIEERAFLQRFKQQTLDETSTWGQRVGKWIIGPVIGGIYAFAMGPVYDGGLLYLGNQSTFVYKIQVGSISSIIVGYITISSAPDGMARNAHLWKRAITYLSTEGQEKGRIFLTGLGCLLPSCIEPTYLITTEMYVMSFLGLHGVNNAPAHYMLALCPALFADSFASNFETAWDGWDSVKERTSEFRSLLSRKLFHETTDPQMKSQATLDREQLDIKLTQLSKFLFREALSEKIEEIYDTVAHLKAQAPADIKEEDLPAYQALRVLNYLLSLGDQIEEGQKQIKSLYEILSDGLNYGCLVLGSPARLLVLEFIGETVFGIFCPKIATKILAWLFALVGFPVQTGLEYQGMQNFFRDFIWHEEPHGHSSHPGLRGTAKTYIMMQGLIFTFPLIVMTLQTCNLWFSSNWWMIGSLPFLIPELAAQVTSFNGTYNRQVATTLTNGYNKEVRKKFGSSPRTDWKRDWLLQLIQASQEEVKGISPELLHIFRSRLTE